MWNSVQAYSKMQRWCSVLLALVLCAGLPLGEAGGGPKRDMTAYCGACKAVIDELKYSVSKEDPKKTIETGNFRVDSTGKQRGVKKTRYAGSEVHLTELLEGVCSLMQNYGESTDPKTGEKGYLRINSRPGETITISNVNFSSGGGKELSDACSYFISEYEDDLVDMFQDEIPQQEMVQELCYEITGYCAESAASHTEL